MSQTKDFPVVLSLLLSTLFLTFFGWYSQRNYIPLFMKEKLLASVVDIGLVVSIWGLAATFSSIIAGLVSNKIGIEGGIFFGSTSMLASLGLLPLSTSTIHVAIAYALGGIAVGFLDSMIGAGVGDRSPPNRLGLAYGAYGMTAILANSTASLTGGLVLSIRQYNALFSISALAAVPAVVTGFLLLSVFRGNSLRRHRIPSKFNFENSTLVLAGLIGTLVSSVNFVGVITFFPTYATSVGFDTITVGLAFSLFFLMGGVIRLPLGVIIDRFGRETHFAALGLLISSLALVALTAIPSTEYILTIMLVNGLGLGLGLTTSYVVVAKGASSNRRLGMGYVNTIRYGSMAVAPPVVATVIEAYRESVFGYFAGFALIGGLGFTGAVIMLFIAEKFLR